jgi:uncharacterized protein YceK
MKQIIYSITFMLFLSGCAKVSQQLAPCTGPAPAPPSIPNQILLLGSSATVTAGNLYGGSAGTTYKWTGPNHFISIQNPLTLDFTDSTLYGLYTVSTLTNGCSSVPDTFYVLANFTGSPSCTISPSQYNTLIAPGVSSFQFSGGASGQSGSICNQYNYDIEATTTSGFTFDFYTAGRPVPGSYYNLTSTCNVNAGQAAAIFSGYDQFGNDIYYYTSSGGKVYCNTISGANYITFCSDTFQNVANGSKFIITGNFQFY